MNPIIGAFAKGIEKAGVKPSQVSVLSDIPFDPEVVKNLGVDFFHTIRGRPIPFGTGLKLANLSLHVVPFVGDLMTLGGNHFAHAARRNMELTVICINNFVYRKIAAQPAPLQRRKEKQALGRSSRNQQAAPTFSPYSTFEQPFNIPHLGNSCGAVYTARWTALHREELANSIAEALNKHGFSVIEVLSPGPNFHMDINEMESNLLNFYYENSVIKNGEEPRNVEIVADEPIIVGKFTDKEIPTFIDSYNAQLSKVLGDKFAPYGAPHLA